MLPTKTTFLLITICCLPGCSRQPAIQTAAAMQASLTSDIPIGTPVASAEAKLKARGFTVTHQTNANWISTTQPSDYLYGQMWEGSIVQRRWQVAVFHQQGVVTGIDVQTGLVGP